MKIKLTKTSIDGLKPKNKAYMVWDTLVTGLFVRVSVSGKKSFYFKFRLKNGLTKKPSFGDFPVVTLDEARVKASFYINQVRQGLDPVKEIEKNVEVLRKKKEKSLRVKDLGERYLKEYAVNKKGRGHEHDASMFKNHINPLIGNIKIIEVKKKDIQNMISSIGENHQTTANRVFALIRKAFNLAEDWDLREQGTNPCKGIKQFKEKSRKRYLSSDEAMRLGTVLKDYEAREGFERKTAWLVLMLIYTGARLNEVLKAKWEWINFDRGVLMLPDTKSNEEQEVQLPTVAIDLLYKIKKYKTKGHSYIFEGAKAGEPMYDEGKHWVKIKEKAGIEDFRIHDLRHAFASIAIMETGSMAFVSGLLRHANIKTTQRYAHLMNDPLQAAANAAANKLHELMNGNVVDLETKRRLG